MQRRLSHSSTRQTCHEEGAKALKDVYEKEATELEGNMLRLDFPTAPSPTMMT